MGATNVQAFRGSDPLTAQALENLVFDLKARLAPAAGGGRARRSGRPADGHRSDGHRPAPRLPRTTTTATTTTTPAPATPPAAPKQVPNGGRAVQMWELDARLVGALGLNDAASTFAKSARAAGLKVPSRFGTEVVARLLGLRLEPSGERRRARAPPAGRRLPRRSRVLGRPDPHASPTGRSRASSRRPQEFSLPSLTDVADADPRHRGRPHRHAVHLGRRERHDRERRSASPRAAATTARASSGVSTRSSGIPARARSLRPFAAARPTR